MCLFVFLLITLFYFSSHCLYSCISFLIPVCSSIPLLCFLAPSLLFFLPLSLLYCFPSLIYLFALPFIKLPLLLCSLLRLFFVPLLSPSFLPYYFLSSSLFHLSLFLLFSLPPLLISPLPSISLTYSMPPNFLFPPCPLSSPHNGVLSLQSCP